MANNQDTVTCQYCERPAALKTGVELYPHRQDLRHVRAWVCAPCDARVGCHNGTTRPKGTLADAATRRARATAHAAFDPIWKTGMMSRRQAYGWLARLLEIERSETHIGHFDVATCNQVTEMARLMRSRVHG